MSFDLFASKMPDEKKDCIQSPSITVVIYSIIAFA